MLALTIRQPWAWAIIHAGKDVENRSWPTNYRGPLAIHAAIKDDTEAMRSPVLHRAIGLQPYQPIHGAVIGIVDVTDCVRDSASPWAVDGFWHWQLSNPRSIKPVHYRGQPGLFQVITVHA